MVEKLVECVPNFSEGRDSARVQSIIDAIVSVPEILPLDSQSDADHNRSVITFAGPPQAVVEAAVRGAGKAVELIDLNRHRGVHPRVGALDVLPFVPLRGIALEDCVRLAAAAGEEIWRRYRVPVYLSDAAARRPDRVNLADVRRGQFEGLREQVRHNPDRGPDIGGPDLHPTAGATVAGARRIMIACNIQLQTADVEIARRIARTIRFSSGGLPHVKAMGVLLASRNVAQVSMNLTDFEQTPLHEVLEAVKREAKHHGVRVAGGEIIGLIPRKALEMAAGYDFGFEDFHPGRILENRLAEALGS